MENLKCVVCIGKWNIGELEGEIKNADTVQSGDAVCAKHIE